MNINTETFYPTLIIILTGTIFWAHTEWLWRYVSRTNEWHIANDIIGSVIILAITIWSFTQCEGLFSRSIICVFGVLSGLSFWGIRYHYSNPLHVADYVANTYVHTDKDTGRSHDVRNDFFDPIIGPIILKEDSLRTKVIQYLDTRTFGFQHPKDILDNRQLAWILLAHYRHHQIPTSKWIDSIEGRALGANLLVAEFPGTLGQYESLLNTKAPYSVMRERTWTDLPKWFVDALPHTPDQYRNIGVLHSEEIIEITKNIIKHHNTSTKLELEAAMLSILSYPQPISDDDFSSLVDTLATQKPMFAHNLEDLKTFRQAVRTQLQKEGHQGPTLSYTVMSDSQSYSKDVRHGCSNKEFRGLILSFGFIPTEGDDITFFCTQESKMLRDGGEYTIPKTQVTKVISEEEWRWDANGESYLREVNKEVVVSETSERTVYEAPVFRKNMKIFWQTKNTAEKNHGILTTTYLDRQYWTPGESYYNPIPPLRDANWLYTVPMSMFY